MDTLTADKQKEIEKRIRELLEDFVDPEDFHPDRVVELGFNSFLADKEQKGSALRVSARNVVEDYEILFRKYLPTTKAGIYFLDMRAAGTRYAHGIKTRFLQRAEKQQFAREERDIIEQEAAFALTWKGMFRVGTRVLLLGGFAGAFVKFFVGYLGLQIGTDGGGANFAALATALGVGVIGTIREVTRTQTVVNRMKKTYYDSFVKAQNDYVRGVREEHRQAITRAREAWEKFTGRKLPNTTEGTENLLEGMAQMSQYAVDEQPSEFMTASEIVDIIKRQLKIRIPSLRKAVKHNESPTNAAP